MSQALSNYIDNLTKIFQELIKLPPEQFNARMNQISNPSIIEFMKTNSTDLFIGEEPIVYCQPSPRAYMEVANLLADEVL